MDVCEKFSFTNLSGSKSSAIVISVTPYKITNVQIHINPKLFQKLFLRLEFFKTLNSSKPFPSGELNEIFPSGVRRNISKSKNSHVQYCNNCNEVKKSAAW